MKRATSVGGSRHHQPRKFSRNTTFIGEGSQAL